MNADKPKLFLFLSAFLGVPPRLILFFLVGLGGLEPPTSSLSGMRSSQLSYRPNFAPLPASGGAGRVGTGDLLSANQALSQLSYSPFFGRQRLPALPPYVSIEASWIQKTMRHAMALSEKPSNSKWRSV